jgi:small subunit ribosomal protein S1
VIEEQPSEETAVVEFVPAVAEAHADAEAEAEATVAPPAEPAAPLATTSEPAAEAPPSDTAAPTATEPKHAASPPRASSLYRALRSRRPVAGRVESVIKGGYEIRVGKVRGFCPHSQIDLHRVDTPEMHVGKTLMFRVTQVRRGGEDVVLSRRAVLEDERREEAAAVRATLIEGAVMQGRVAGLAEFGAFVDLGAGVMGLVHVSEVSHARVARVEDALSEGDAVQVKILKIHPEGRKISLSVRQAAADPWDGVETRFAPGSVHTGVVRRLAAFGAFVELAPGVEALAPASEFAPDAEGWSHGLEVGQTRDWLVLSVDGAQRRISIVPPVEGHDASATDALQIGATVAGRVQRVEDFGVFVWLAPGRVGLMPQAWTGVPRGEVRRRFPVGQAVEVEVREVGDDRRRLRLSLKGAFPKPERAERPPRREAKRVEPPAPPPRKPEPGPETVSFGTSLGDKLRAALAQSSDRR